MFGLGIGEIIGGAAVLAFIIFLGWKIFGPKKAGSGSGGFGGSDDSDTNLK